MENCISKMVNDVPKVNYHELDDLLKIKNNENKKKFVEGYMLSLYRLTCRMYNSRSDLFDYYYEFEDFYSDAIEIVTKKYNTWNYVDRGKEYTNILWFSLHIRSCLLKLLDKKQREKDAHECEKSLSEIDLVTNFFEDILIDKIDNINLLQEILELIDSRLSDKKKAIAYRYFGIGEESPKTCADVAKEFDLSTTYVGFVKQHVHRITCNYMKEKNKRIHK